jgi:predicted dehydrogenase
MNKQNHPSRRQFISGLGAFALAAPAIVPSSIFGAGKRPPPSGRINLGFIGVGIMARGHLGSFLGYGETQVMAVCDVSAVRRDHAVQMVHKAYAKQKESGEYKGCAGYVDFRELLDRADIDAVVIGTPDHWHAIPAILAARAGKDVYCEKPLSLTIAEARAMVNSARKNKIVFQTGSQQRTEFGGKFRLACELVRSGRIGRVRTIRVGVGDPPRPCDLPEEPLPEGIDWDRWLGPSPRRGFSAVLCPKEVHNHFPQWRAYSEFAGGGLADMGAHHFDIAQWALGMDESGPVEIVPPEPPARTGLRFKYANGVIMYHGGPSGVTFEGSDGTLYVDRDKMSSNPETILKEPLGERDVHLEDPGNNHKKNWLACIQSRKKPIADVEIGARTATVCHLANLGYQLRRTLHWNPAREKFLNDKEANAWIDRPRRAPWDQVV